MKPFVFFILLIINILLANNKANNEISLTEPRDIVKLMIHKYNSYKNYEAAFKEINQGRFRKGKIFLKKPEKLYIQYLSGRKPTIEIFVSASKLYVYFKRIQIVCEQDLNLIEDKEKIFNSKTTSLNRLIKRYHFEFVSSRKAIDVLSPQEKIKFNSYQNLKGYHLRLTSKDVSLGLANMELWVSPAGLIIRSKAISIDKKVTDILFYNIKIGGFIPSSKFEFEVPITAQIVKNTLMDLNETQKKN